MCWLGQLLAGVPQDTEFNCDVQRAENQLRRNEPLYREKLVSEDVYDLSLQTLEMYRSEVREKSNAIHHIEQRLAELKGFGILSRVTTVTGIPTRGWMVYGWRRYPTTRSDLCDWIMMIGSPGTTVSPSRRTIDETIPEIGATSVIGAQFVATAT